MLISQRSPFQAQACKGRSTSQALVRADVRERAQWISRRTLFPQQNHGFLATSYEGDSHTAERRDSLRKYTSPSHNREQLSSPEPLTDDEAVSKTGYRCHVARLEMPVDWLDCFSSDEPRPARTRKICRTSSSRYPCAISEHLHFTVLCWTSAIYHPAV